MTADVVVHANAGDDVGLGHLVRCTVLVNELQSQGIGAQLRIKDDEDAVAFVRSEGLEPATSAPATLREDLLASAADVVVVDSYAFTSDDFERLTDEQTLVVVDELGDRHVPADLVVNNNIYADDVEYPAAESVCRGPDYCMLRQSFRDLPRPEHRQPPERVLLTIGGADIADVFTDVLELTAAAVPTTTAVDTVVGPYFEQPESPPEGVVFHRAPSNLPELMWRADLAVSGGGQTLYELAASGTPAVAITLGDDQVRNIDGFEASGACRAVGRPEVPDFESRLRDALTGLCDAGEERSAMSDRCRTIVDGDGAPRVARRIVDLR